MAASQIRSKPRALFGLSWIGWAVYHLFSLETVLVLFLYAAHLKALLPSPPLPETVFYGLISIVIGCWIIFREGIYRGGIPIVVAGLVFTGWVLLSYGWTSSVTLARENLPFILGVNIWALFVGACVVAGSRERVIRLLLLMVVLGAILAGIGSYIYLIHGDFRFYRGPYGEWHHRTYLAWSNTITTGTAVALALTLYTRIGSPRQFVAGAILACCMFFLMISAARGALLGALLAGVLALLLNTPRIRDGRIEMPRTQILAVLLVVGLLGYIGYLVGTGQATGTVARFMRLFDQVDNQLLRTGANRFDYFVGAYRAWLEAPLIGQGLNGFAIYFCGYDAPGCHPHNIILQTLADYGLFGFILFGIFVWTGVRRFRLSALQSDPLLMTLMMAFVTLVMYSMVAIDLPTTHRLFFFLGLLALRPPDETTEDEIMDEPGEA